MAQIIFYWLTVNLPQDCHFLFASLRLICPLSGAEDAYGRCGSSRSAARCCAGRWTAVLVFGLIRAGSALWAGAWGWWSWCAAGASGWPRARLPEALGSACCPLSDGRRHQASEESCPCGWLLQRSGSGSGWSDTQHTVSLLADYFTDRCLFLCFDFNWRITCSSKMRKQSLATWIPKHKPVLSFWT